MSYKKSILKIVILAVVAFCIFSIRSNKVLAFATIADSGFDSSYDSGGGGSWSSGGSDYSYSSSDSSYSSSGSSGEMSDSAAVLLLLFIIGVIIYGALSNRKTYTPKPTMTMPNQDEIEKKIKQYIPDFDKAKFLEDGYQIYLDIQDAWMNFKLDDVKGKLTDELFNMYQSQLDTLEVKGEQNIMKDFKLNKSYLKDVLVQNENIAIKAVFVVDFYDYIINQGTGKVLRGSDKQKIRITYEMMFRKTLNKDNVTLKCPNCGGDMTHINGYGVCQYCRTKIVTENQEWVLTDKKSINQIRL